MPNNSERENMEARPDGVTKLPESPPTCPLSSRFLYTLRWLIIQVAFCIGFEPTNVRKRSLIEKPTTKLLGSSNLSSQVPGQPEVA